MVGGPILFRRASIGFAQKLVFCALGIVATSDILESLEITGKATKKNEWHLQKLGLQSQP
jgi:hypothetical protein